MNPPVDLKPTIEKLLQSTTSKSAKADIKSYLSSDPNGFVLSLLDILKGGNNEFSIRLEALKQLEKNFGASSEDSKWPQLTEETASKFFNALFEIFEQIPEKSESKQEYYESIGEIGSQIIFNTDEPDNVPESGLEAEEFDNRIAQYLQSSNEDYQLGALAVMSAGFLFHPERYEGLVSKLEKLYDHIFTKENIYLKHQVVQTTMSYWDAADLKKKIPFSNVLNNMFGFYDGLVGKNDHLVMKFIVSLQEIFDADKKILKNKLEEIYNFAKKYSNSQDADQKQESQALLTKLIEAFPQKTLKYLNELLTLIFEQLEECIQDLDDEWEKQVDKNDDFATVLFQNQLVLLDQICAVSPDACLTFFVQKIKPQLERSSSWKRTAAMLMGLSQIGEHYSVQEIDGFVKIALKETQNEHIKVRYAAYHFIGQIAEDLTQEFASKYFEQFLVVLGKAFTETSDKVLGHALASGTNFFESSSKESLAPYISQLLQPLLQFIDTKPTAVKEDALSCISSIAEAAGDCFKPFWKQISELVFALLKNAVAPELKVLRGQAIECLTLIGHSIGKEEFQQAIPNIVAEIDKLSQQVTYADDSDLVGYVLSGWQRITILLEKDVQKYEEPVKKAFRLACTALQEMIEMKPSLIEDGNEGSKIKDIDLDFNAAQSCMGRFLEDAPKLVCDNELLELCCKANSSVFQSQFTDGKDKAGQISKRIVQAVVKELSNTQIKMAICKNQLQSLFEEIENDYDPRDMGKIGASIQEIFEAMVGLPLTESDYFEYSNRLTNIIESSKQRVIDNNNFANEQDDEDAEEDEMEQIKTDNRMEELLQLVVVEIYSALVCINKQDGLPFALKFYQTQFQPLLQNEDQITTQQKIKILYFVDDMIEKFGYEPFKSQWEEFEKIIYNNVEDEDAEVRQAAIYGVGQYARTTPTELFKDKTKSSLDLLVKVYFAPKSKEWADKEYQYIIDNILSSVGKILVYQKESVENYKQMYTQLVKFLPLKKDKTEGKTLHKDIYTLAMTHGDEILSEETVVQLIEIAYKLSGYKIGWFEDDIKTAIQQFIEKYRYDEKYGEALIQKINSLPGGNVIREMCPSED